MRFVAKDLTDTPGIFGKASVIEDLEKIAGGQVQLIKDAIYKDSYVKDGKSESRVRDHLNKHYHQKCAYCEMFCKAEIEHYRPKKGVDEDQSHPGYYWLCYEWSNLVPSCRYCNTEGGKGNKFPILGQRVSLPEFTGGKLNRTATVAHNRPLIDEQPALLHPEIDDPKTFFTYKIATDKSGITIVGTDNSTRGNETIRICNLNRQTVQIDRLQTVVYPIVKGFDLIFEYVRNGIIDQKDIAKALKICFQQALSDATNVHLPHTLLRWHITNTSESFVEIVLPLIGNENQREIIANAFVAFKEGRL